MQHEERQLGKTPGYSWFLHDRMTYPIESIFFKSMNLEKSRKIL
jgi:hypothetical protein